MNGCGSKRCLLQTRWLRRRGVPAEKGDCGIAQGGDTGVASPTSEDGARVLSDRAEAGIWPDARPRARLRGVDSNASSDWDDPAEIWNRLGTKILPKLRSGSDLKLGLDFSLTVPGGSANGLVAELQQILQELGVSGSVKVDRCKLSSFSRSHGRDQLGRLAGIAAEGPGIGNRIAVDGRGQFGQSA